MSVEKLKKTVAALSPSEQNELTAFLFTFGIAGTLHIRRP
jgi:hypothetical protein